MVNATSIERVRIDLEFVVGRVDLQIARLVAVVALQRRASDEHRTWFEPSTPRRLHAGFAHPTLIYRFGALAMVVTMPVMYMDGSAVNPAADRACGWRNISGQARSVVDRKIESTR